MNNIRRFRYVKPIYKKSVILNDYLLNNHLRIYKHPNYALVNNNKKSYSNLVSYSKSESELVLYTKPKSDLVLYNKSDLALYNKSDLALYNKSDLALYNKPDLGLILYQLNNNLLDIKSNKYLYRYLLFKIAYFINFIV